MLEIQDLHAYYGTSYILQGISLKSEKGSISSILGRNGAGKTTTLKSIMGIVREKRGKITFNGTDIMGKRPYQIARLGIGYVPEDRRIYPGFNVRENLEIAQQKSSRRGGYWELDKIYTLFPHLEEMGEKRLGREMSGGEQQMLTVARTLMGNPELLLLDEPSEGLAPLVVSILAKSVKDIKKSGVNVLLAEQSTRFAVKTADWVYVIDDGRIFFEGTVEGLQKDEEVLRRHIIV